MSVKLRVIGVAAVCALTSGVLLGAWFGPDPVLDTVAGADGARQFIGVSAQPFDDARQVELKVSHGKQQALRLSASGVVTERHCQARRDWHTGQVVLNVNDVPVIAVATSRPPWRDLTFGDKGPDVRAIQRTLRALGWSSPLTGVVDAQTSRVIAAFLRSRGWSGENSTLTSGDMVLPLAMLVWLPRSPVAVATCQVVRGDLVQSGTVLAKLRLRSTSAAPKTLPEDLVAGQRELTVDDVSVPVNKQGQVQNTKDLERLLGTPSGKLWAQSNGKFAFRATLSLVKKLEVSSVPPAAVIDAQKAQPCLIAEDGAPITVKIITSQLGTTLVMPSKGAVVPARVMLDQNGNVTCA